MNDIKLEKNYFKDTSCMYTYMTTDSANYETQITAITITN